MAEEMRMDKNVSDLGSVDNRENVNGLRVVKKVA